ncbi:MAG: manganese efflux pump [Acetivibrio sp.]
MILRMIIMSISLSIDAFGIGISYQLKGIYLSMRARVFIGIISAGVMAFSIAAGQEMLEFFPNNVSKKIGTAILILAGGIFIRNAIFGSGENSCDLDKSKDINFLEAFLLGIALSADCLSIGIAAATFPISTIGMPICVGIMQCIFLWMGKAFVEKKCLRKEINEKMCGILAGCILIVIGLFR